MDVNFVNPFVESFNNVMPQLGFNQIQLGKLCVKDKEIFGTGVIIILGIVGDIKGNVAYMLETEAAIKIASAMMMGMPVEDFDDLAQSALSELTNMLTANAATAFSNFGVRVDISTPTMLQGADVSVKMSAGKILCIPFVVDDIPIDINIAFEDKQN